jgi:hypothetical protein
MSKVWDKQIGGQHYQKFKIQPSKFVVENKLLFPEGCPLKEKKKICLKQYILLR